MTQIHIYMKKIIFLAYSEKDCTLQRIQDFQNKCYGSARERKSPGFYYRSYSDPNQQHEISKIGKGAGLGTEKARIKHSNALMSACLY